MIRSIDMSSSAVHDRRRKPAGRASSLRLLKRVEFALAFILSTCLLTGPALSFPTGRPNEEDVSKLPGELHSVEPQEVPKRENVPDGVQDDMRSDLSANNQHDSEIREHETFEGIAGTDHANKSSPPTEDTETDPNIPSISERESDSWNTAESTSNEKDVDDVDDKARITKRHVSRKRDRSSSRAARRISALERFIKRAAAERTETSTDASREVRDGGGGLRTDAANSGSKDEAQLQQGHSSEEARAEEKSGKRASLIRSAAQDATPAVARTTAEARPATVKSLKTEASSSEIERRGRGSSDSSEIWKALELLTGGDEQLLSTSREEAEGNGLAEAERSKDKKGGRRSASNAAALAKVSETPAETTKPAERSEALMAALKEIQADLEKSLNKGASVGVKPSPSKRGLEKNEESNSAGGIRNSKSKEQEAQAVKGGRKRDTSRRPENRGFDARERSRSRASTAKKRDASQTAALVPAEANTQWKLLDSSAQDRANARKLIARIWEQKVNAKRAPGDGHSGNSRTIHVSGPTSSNAREADTEGSLSSSEEEDEFLAGLLDIGLSRSEIADVIAGLDTIQESQEKKTKEAQKLKTTSTAGTEVKGSDAVSEDTESSEESHGQSNNGVTQAANDGRHMAVADTENVFSEESGAEFLKFLRRLSSPTAADVAEILNELARQKSGKKGYSKQHAPAGGLHADSFSTAADGSDATEEAADSAGSYKEVTAADVVVHDARSHLWAGAFADVNIREEADASERKLKAEFVDTLQSLDLSPGEMTRIMLELARMKETRRKTGKKTKRHKSARRMVSEDPGTAFSSKTSRAKLEDHILQKLHESSSSNGGTSKYARRNREARRVKRSPDEVHDSADELPENLEVTSANNPLTE